MVWGITYSIKAVFYVVFICTRSMVSGGDTKYNKILFKKLRKMDGFYSSCPNEAYCLVCETAETTN